MTVSCPECRSQDVRRVKRNSLILMLKSLLGSWPYVCQACGHRFSSRKRRVRRSHSGPDSEHHHSEHRHSEHHHADR